MKFSLHPEAAQEHTEQIGYYEAQRSGLGIRYHLAFMAAVDKACTNPGRFRIELAPSIRRVTLAGFPLYVLYRQRNEVIHILAVAHHRKRPGYWQKRV